MFQLRVTAFLPDGWQLRKGLMFLILFSMEHLFLKHEDALKDACANRFANLCMKQLILSHSKRA